MIQLSQKTLEIIRINQYWWYQKVAKILTFHVTSRTILLRVSYLIRDSVDWGRKWLVDFSAGKTRLLFDWSNNSDAIDVKIGGSILEEKPSFKMLGLSFCPQLDWGS